MNREEKHLRELEQELNAPDAPEFIKNANERWAKWQERWLEDRESGYADNVKSFRDRVARRRDAGQ